MVLGAAPLLTGYALVELGALLNPVWRPLRQGGPAGRAKLHHGSLIVGILVELGQAWFLATGWGKMGVDYDYGASSRVITILILLGATAGQRNASAVPAAVFRPLRSGPDSGDRGRSASRLCPTASAMASLERLSVMAYFSLPFRSWNLFSLVELAPKVGLGVIVGQITQKSRGCPAFYIRIGPCYGLTGDQQAHANHRNPAIPGVSEPCAKNCQLAAAWSNRSAHPTHAHSLPIAIHLLPSARQQAARCEVDDGATRAAHRIHPSPPFLSPAEPSWDREIPPGQKNRARPANKKRSPLRSGQPLCAVAAIIHR
jgi:hypothetical protein